MKKILTTIILTVFCAVFLTADIYVKQLNHTDAISFMGQQQPAKDEYKDMWFGKNKMALHGDDQSFIFNLDENVAYMIYHKKKTYIELKLPLDMSQYLPAEASQMLQMIGEISITVTPTGETQKIKEWKCDGYDINMSMMMMNLKMKVWACPDVPIDWKKFSEKMLQMANPTMPLSEKAIQEFMKIKGFQIKTEMSMSMMGADMKSYQEVVELMEKSAPAETYSAPAGYTKQNKLSMEDMRRR